MNYVEWAEDKERDCKNHVASRRSPGAYNAESRDTLDLLNRGDGTFEDVSEASRGCARARATGSASRAAPRRIAPGLDVYVANDGNANASELARGRTALRPRHGDGLRAQRQRPCGGEHGGGRLDRDGSWDLMLSTSRRETNTFLGGGRGYRDRTLRNPIDHLRDASRAPASAMALADFDHDGWLDLWTSPTAASAPQPARGSRACNGDRPALPARRRALRGPRVRDHGRAAGDGRPRGRVRRHRRRRRRGRLHPRVRRAPADRAERRRGVAARRAVGAGA